MKRVLTIISVAVLALTTAVSCSKNNAIDIDRSHTITFVADDEVAFSRTELDATGKKAGRGAYICKCLECLKKVQKKKGLEHSAVERLKESIKCLQPYLVRNKHECI